ncbi:unnamed protein product, partial [Aphanomyces euteiches]
MTHLIRVSSVVVPRLFQDVVAMPQRGLALGDDEAKLQVVIVTIHNNRWSFSSDDEGSPIFAYPHGLQQATKWFFIERRSKLVLLPRPSLTMQLVAPLLVMASLALAQDFSQDTSVMRSLSENAVDAWAIVGDERSLLYAAKPNPAPRGAAKPPAAQSQRKPATPLKKSGAAKPTAKKPAAKKPAAKNHAKKPAAKSRAKKPAAKSRAKKPAAKSRGKKPAGKSRGKKPARKNRGKKPASKSRGKKPASKSRGKKPAPKSRGKKPASKSRGKKP